MLDNNILRFGVTSGHKYNPPSNQPGGKKALEMLQEIKQPLIKIKKESISTLTTKIINSNLGKQSTEAADFLLRLNYLVQNAHVPDCAGMSPQVAGRLLSQPLIQTSGIAVVTQTMQAVRNPGLSHTYNNISGIICDSWRPPYQGEPVVCTNYDINNKEKPCNFYHPSFWRVTTRVSLQWPDLSGIGHNERRFFRREARLLFQELRRQEDRAEEYYRRLTQG